jgi:ketosteroid isomerase-like protein
MNEDILSRIDRIESVDAIRQLVSAYGFLLDGRDIDALVDLYSDDIEVGRLRGKAALRESFVRLLGQESLFRTTIHFVGNQVIEFDQENLDRASGLVYCRAEHELDGKWVVAMLQYRDLYRRIDNRWLFVDRQMKAFYAVDVLQRPNGAERVKHQVTTVGLLGKSELPESWVSWKAFWGENDATQRDP